MGPDWSNSPRKGLFSVDIQDVPFSEVMRIDPLVYSTSLVPSTQRAGQQSAIPRDLSTVRIELPESKAAGLYAWHKSFVTAGVE